MDSILAAPFGQLDIEAFNAALEDRSYVLGGSQPTAEDAALLITLEKQSDSSKSLPVNVTRWSKHISSFTNLERSQWTSNTTSSANNMTNKIPATLSSNNRVEENKMPATLPKNNKVKENKKPATLPKNNKVEGSNHMEVGDGWLFSFNPVCTPLLCASLTITHRLPSVSRIRFRYISIENLFHSLTLHLSLSTIVKLPTILLIFTQTG